jgi:hypothetical protein
LTWKAGLRDALANVESLNFFLQVKNDTTTLHAVRFPHVSNQEEDMKHMTSACEEGTFGKAGKEAPVLDPSYRCVFQQLTTPESELDVENASSLLLHARSKGLGVRSA